MIQPDSYCLPWHAAGGGRWSEIYLAASDGLEATAARVREAGGMAVSEPIKIPFGSFLYATDPDRNSIGFFEA